MKKLNSRTVHRYLSIVIGVQLLFWTTSGLIFSWNPIGKVRGEHLIRDAAAKDLSAFSLLGLPDLVSRNEAELGSRKITAVALRTMLGEPVYELTTIDSSGKLNRPAIYHASSGAKWSPVTEQQATQIAIQDFADVVQTKSVEWIEGGLSSHSEYRGKELPVWRVVLDHPTGTVIYVSADRGVVTTRRNNRWRVFDFFWMLHTMDYQGRDNFNSWLLRSFSIFGVATVVSGYWLWWRSSAIRRRWQSKRKSK